MSFTFFHLPDKDIYHICSFLPVKSIVALSETNKTFNYLLNKKHKFYLPVYERDQDFQKLEAWKRHDGLSTSKVFYRTAENLFSKVPLANGCYKINLSWFDILKIIKNFKQQHVFHKKFTGDDQPSNYSFKIDSLGQAEYIWHLTVAAKYIESYIDKTTRKEISNPFYIKPINSPTAITSKLQCAII